MNAIHSKADYGQLAQVLDDSWRFWARADRIAAAANYEDAAANECADRRWARYLDHKQQALRAQMRCIEILPVGEGEAV